MKLFVTILNVRRKQGAYGKYRNKGREWIPLWNDQARGGQGAYAIEVRDDVEFETCAGDLFGCRIGTGCHHEFTSEDKELLESGRRVHAEAAAKALAEARARKAAHDKQAAIDRVKFKKDQDEAAEAQRLANDPAEIQRQKDAADEARRQDGEEQRAAYQARKAARDALEEPAAPEAAPKPRKAAPEPLKGVVEAQPEAEAQHPTPSPESDPAHQTHKAKQSKHSKSR